MTDKKKGIEPDEWQAWLTENVSWLTEWLANVVMISEADARQSGATFQTFRVTVNSEGIGGMLQANNELNYLLIASTILGYHSDGIAKASGGWDRPPMFSGFLEAVGRMPMLGDTVLFTATKWHTLEYWTASPIVAIGGIPGKNRLTLVSECSVDFVPNKQVAQT